jgi:hypothetical protein
MFDNRQVGFHKGQRYYRPAFAKLNGGSFRKGYLSNPATVNKGTITAPEIPDDQAIRPRLNRNMPAAHRRIVYLQPAVIGTADDKLPGKTQVSLGGIPFEYPCDNRRAIIWICSIELFHSNSFTLTFSEGRSNHELNCRQVMEYLFSSARHQ